VEAVIVLREALRELVGVVRILVQVVNKAAIIL
jgi:hypothetical protein